MASVGAGTSAIAMVSEYVGCCSRQRWWGVEYPRERKLRFAVVKGVHGPVCGEGQFAIGLNTLYVWIEALRTAKRPMMDDGLRTESN